MRFRERKKLAAGIEKMRPTNFKVRT